MIFGFFRRLFSAGDTPPSVTRSDGEAFDYKGYSVKPSPIKEDSGWRVAGFISQEMDGETRIHELIRADVFPGEAEALDITAGKARRLIDEQGERIFRERS